MDILFAFVDFLTLPRVGLLYDIAGAFVLGYGSLTGKSREEEATLHWKEDVIRRGIIIGKREARVGLGLLGGGIILQLFSGTAVEGLTLLGVLLSLQRPKADYSKSSFSFFLISQGASSPKNSL